MASSQEFMKKIHESDSDSSDEILICLKGKSDKSAKRGVVGITASGDTSSATNEDASDAASGDASSATSGDTSGAASGDASNATNEDASGDASSATSGDASGAASGDASSATSGNASDAASGDASSATNGDTSDAASGEASGTTSGDASDAANRAISGDASDAVSADLVGATSGDASSATSGDASGATNGDVIGTASGDVVGAIGGSVEEVRGKGKNDEANGEEAAAPPKRKVRDFDFRYYDFTPWDFDFFRDDYFEWGYDLFNLSMPEIDSRTLAKYAKEYENKKPKKDPPKGLGYQSNGFKMFEYVAKLNPKYCFLHNCKATVSHCFILAHLAHFHFFWGLSDEPETVHCVFNDTKVTVSVDEKSCIFGQINCLGVLAYGGDGERDPPGMLDQCPRNSLLNAFLLPLKFHLPIILMALKVPASMDLTECRQKIELIKQGKNLHSCDPSEKLLIWASSHELPYNLRLKMIAVNGVNKIVQFKQFNVRYDSKVTQNPYEFERYDTDFFTLSYEDLRNLTYNFQKSFELYMCIKELPRSPNGK